MKQGISIKTRIHLGVFFLISIIILAMTALTYQQYNSSQMKKLQTDARAIISPFYELIKKELPDENKYMDLYLKVAVQSKGNSQVPSLFYVYKHLEGLSFSDNKNKELLKYGKITTHSQGQVQLSIPFKINSHIYGSTLLAFSTKNFEEEKIQILKHAGIVFALFLVIGYFTALLAQRSIIEPIERLSKHIELNEFEHLPLLQRQDEIGDFSRIINTLAITLKKREGELEFKAYFDALTNLVNRRLLIDRLNHLLSLAQRDSQTLSVLFIDLNAFKFVNDTYGHDIGNQLLKQFAQRIGKSIRKSDVFARISGDEFSIVLFDLSDLALVALYCKNIFKQLEEPFNIEDKSIYVSVSIGIASYPDDAMNSEILLRNADTAMYHAKELCGNQYSFYHEGLHLKNIDRVALEVEFRKAIVDGTIDLHYQAKIDLYSAQLMGMEVLARWTHPEYGPISPEKFIPLAEEIGLIGELGTLVMLKSCQQMKVWIDDGMSDMIMAINLSPQQFSNANLLGMIKNILQKTGLDAKYIELEITESSTMNQPSYALEILKEIDAMGISIALDDFGTGYSSLSRLHEFPFSTLKLDQSFTKDLGKRKETDTFVQAIIHMSKALDMKIVIEGVETQEQLDVLSGMDAEEIEIQGYFYSRPLNAEKFIAFAKARENKEILL